MIRLIFILFCFVGYGQIANNPYITFPAVSCTSVNSEGDATDFCFETNTVGSNWNTSNKGPSGTVTSVATASAGHDYSLKFVVNDAGCYTITLTISGLENGADYDVYIMAKAENAAAGASDGDFITISSAAGVVTTTSWFDLFGTTFNEEVKSITTDATSIDILVYADGNTCASGYKIWIDYIRLIKTS